LPSVTPSIFLERKTNFSNLDEWEELRLQSLKNYAEVCDIDLISEVYNYVNDEAISKHHNEAILLAYEQHYQDIKLSEKFYNSICINQNLFEGIIILFLFDKKYKTNLYSSSALKLITNMFTSPLIDMWAKKRIHYILATLTLGYHDKNFAAKYFDCLAASPSRRELYSEYFYESHDKKFNYMQAENLEDIGNLFGIISYPPQDNALTYSNFLHYFSDNLGESYSMHFTEEERMGFLLKSYPGEYYCDYVNDVLKFTSQHVFTRFSHYLTSYLKHFSKKDVAKPKNLHRIIYEYFKLQVAQRYRINLNYSKYHGIAYVVTFPAKKEDVYSVILKHERKTNRLLTDEVIASVKKYLSQVEDAQLVKVLRAIEENDRKEIPRFPISYSLIIEMIKNPASLNMQKLEQMRLI
jgi:hypothetical protein